MRFEKVKDEFRKFPNRRIKLPERKTTGSAAYDFYINEEKTLYPGRVHIFWTDVKCKLDIDKVLLLSIRSSLGKDGLQLANAPGVVDSDYYSNPGNDGNIGFMIVNNTNYPLSVKKGDRIGQGMILKYYTTEEDETSKSREGGFGSTGD